MRTHDRSSWHLASIHLIHLPEKHQLPLVSAPKHLSSSLRPMIRAFGKVMLLKILDTVS